MEERTSVKENGTKQRKTSKFVNLLYDSGFKIVYADKANKGLQIDLLNVILLEDAQMEDIIDYCDWEQLTDTKKEVDLTCCALAKTKLIISWRYNAASCTNHKTF